jgi:DNA-directed RNA polymerase subunit beta'
MIISSTITKKVLETIVHETFSTFGIFSSSSLLDSLKLLGFYYATNAGVSINIEDLKTPDVKKKFIETANQEIDFVSARWQQGFVSDVERFQSIIDSTVIIKFSRIVFLCDFCFVNYWKLFREKFLITN